MASHFGVRTQAGIIWPNPVRFADNETHEQGKAVLVTGGGKGIGRMISEGFVTNGARVYISSRDDKACEKAAAELTALGTSQPILSPRLRTLSALRQA